MINEMIITKAMIDEARENVEKYDGKEFREPVFGVKCHKAWASHSEHEAIIYSLMVMVNSVRILSTMPKERYMKLKKRIEREYKELTQEG